MENKKNPVAVLFLCACPALASTATIKGAAGMALAVCCVMVLSALVMALLKKVFDGSLKMAVCVIVTAGFSAAAQMLLAAFLPKAYAMLGIYVAVCAIAAMMSQVDAKIGCTVLSAVEFAVFVVLMGVIRQLLGNVMGVFTTNVGALIVYAILLACVNAIPCKCCKKEAK